MYQFIWRIAAGRIQILPSGFLSDIYMGWSRYVTWLSYFLMAEIPQFILPRILCTTCMSKDYHNIIFEITTHDWNKKQYRILSFCWYPTVFLSHSCWWRLQITLWSRTRYPPCLSSSTSLATPVHLASKDLTPLMSTRTQRLSLPWAQSGPPMTTLLWVVTFVEQYDEIPWEVLAFCPSKWIKPVDTLHRGLVMSE